MRAKEGVRERLMRANNGISLYKLYIYMQNG